MTTIQTNKGEQMIDLTKDHVFANPIKCWVRDKDESVWKPRWLVIVKNNEYHTVDSINHDIEIDILGSYKYGLVTWQQCTLTNPAIQDKKIKKWETIEDVPPALWGKVLVKNKKARPQFAVVMSPCNATNSQGTINNEGLHYLPLGQPLDGEWLPFEGEVVEHR